MKKNTMRKILALALVLAMTAGCMPAAFAETVTNTVSIFSLMDEEIERKVDGDVEVEDKTGVNVNAKNSSSAEVEVTGDVTSEGDGATAVSVYARNDAEATVIVGGEVEAVSTRSEPADDYGRARGIEANASGNGEVTVKTGDVTTEGLSYNAVQVIVSDNAAADVTVGDIDASGEGIRVETSGGSANVDTGDIEAGTAGAAVSIMGGEAVVSTGEIQADEMGVVASFDADWEQTNLSQAEFNALNLDPGAANEYFAYVDGDDTTHYTRNWKDSEGVNYNVMGYYSDETTFVEESHWKNAPVYNSGKGTITVDGGITVDNEDGAATGLQINKNPNIQGTSLDVTVNGDVDVTSASSQATGVAVYYAANGADYDVKISGDVNVSSEKLAYMYGIVAQAHEADVNIDVDGGLSVTLANGEETQIIGIDAMAEEDGNVSITVGEGVEVVSKNTVDDVSAFGIRALTGSSGDNKLEINVLDGGVKVDNDVATAISVSNASGEVDISIKGDVVSSGTGLSLSTGYYGMTDSEKESAPETDTNILVQGDITAADTGVRFTVPYDKASMDVIVDGTISGEVSSVVLMDETVTDNVTLTVWEIKPNDEGSVAQTQTWTFNEETMRQQRVFEEDAGFEKQIQYIIRVEQPNIGFVAAAGTKQYEGYDVAHEGDTVTLKVTVPDGYKLVDAFNGTDTKVQLMKDANDDFFLVVPRGGAVTLSVKLEKEESKKESSNNEEVPVIAVTPVDYTPEPAQEPAPEAEPEKMDDAQIAAAVEELLTKNGVLENSVVEVETDDSGAKTVVISPETIEAGEESTVLQLTVPAEMLTQLADSDVQQIRMVSQSGGATVSMDIAAVLEAAADKQGVKLVMNIEENSESVQNALQAVPAGFTGRAGAVTVTARIEDAEGNVIMLDSSANITLTLNVEFEEGMKILFVDADGNVSETKAVWIEAADGVPGHWEVPFLGEGTYLPVVADK